MANLGREACGYRSWLPLVFIVLDSPWSINGQIYVDSSLCKMIVFKGQYLSITSLANFLVVITVEVDLHESPNLPEIIAWIQTSSIPKERMESKSRKDSCSISNGAFCLSPESRCAAPIEQNALRQIACLDSKCRFVVKRYSDKSWPYCLRKFKCK